MAFCSVAIARDVVFDVGIVWLRWIPMNVPYCFSCWVRSMSETLNPLKAWVYVGLYQVTKLYSIIFEVIKTCMGIGKGNFQKGGNIDLLLVAVLRNLYFSVYV